MESMTVVFRGTHEWLQQYYKEHLLPVFLARKSGVDGEIVFVSSENEAAERAIGLRPSP